MIWHEKLYRYAANISILLLFLSYFGLGFINKNYINAVRIVIRLYIALILIIRFNPYFSSKIKNKNVCNTRIAYDAGWWLLITTLTMDMFQEYIVKFKRIYFLI